MGKTTETSDQKRTHGSGVCVRLTVNQQKYLPHRAGAQDMYVIVTVEVDGAPGAAGEGTPGAGPAEVLVVDCSSSMRGEKIRAAGQATATALEMLPDATPFAVVRGSHQAEMVFPSEPFMAEATSDLRADAIRQVRRLVPSGGTAIGSWLDLARRLLDERTEPIKHVLLLTDGRNEHDRIKPLADVLAECRGRFVCDAWGVGDGWDAQELLGIARSLHGSADEVADASALPGEYAQLMRRLLGKTIPTLRLRVTPSPGARLRSVKQVHPTELDLAPEAPRGDGHGVDFLTRAWGNETRRYQLQLTADPAGQYRNEDLQLAAVEVLEVHAPSDDVGTRLPGPEPCLVHWTDDPVDATRTDRHVAHYRLYEQLGQAAARAWNAYRTGDHRRAETELGWAVALAQGLGDARQLRRLEQLVEVVDAESGAVRLRAGVTTADFHRLITASTHTTLEPEPLPPPAEPDQPDLLPCPSCSGPSPAGARFCPHCGVGLPEPS